MKIYIAGPMRGIPLYNFPSFDAAAERIRAAGHDPINPADLDRAIGVFETTDPLPEGFLRGAMKRDLSAITECDAISLLPGWYNSKGVAVELALANLLGLDVLDAETLKPFTETICDEAKRIVYNDRAKDYGHPLDECVRIAGMWTQIIGAHVVSDHIPLCMIAMKISRQLNRAKRDNIVDIAGYAECAQRIIDERLRRAAEDLDPDVYVEAA
jgi:hypothetical protein